MGNKQKTTLKADYIALNKPGNECWAESKREVLPCPVYRGEHICWSIMASQHEIQGWNQTSAYVSAHFHYGLKMMLHEMNQLSTARCANVHKQCGNSSVPFEFPWISFFCYFWIPLLPPLTTNLLYNHFPHLSKIHQVFSSHSTKTFIQALILLYLLTLPLFICLSLSL